MLKNINSQKAPAKFPAKSIKGLTPRTSATKSCIRDQSLQLPRFAVPFELMKPLLAKRIPTEQLPNHGFKDHDGNWVIGTNPSLFPGQLPCQYCRDHTSPRFTKDPETGLQKCMDCERLEPVTGWCYYCEAGWRTDSARITTEEYLECSTWFCSQDCQTGFYDKTVDLTVRIPHLGDTTIRCRGIKFRQTTGSLMFNILHQHDPETARLIHAYPNAPNEWHLHIAGAPQFRFKDHTRIGEALGTEGRPVNLVLYNERHNDLVRDANPIASIDEIEDDDLVSSLYQEPKSCSVYHGDDCWTDILWDKISGTAGDILKRACDDLNLNPKEFCLALDGKKLKNTCELRFTENMDFDIENLPKKQEVRNPPTSLEVDEFLFRALGRRLPFVPKTGDETPYVWEIDEEIGIFVAQIPEQQLKTHGTFVPRRFISPLRKEKRFIVIPGTLSYLRRLCDDYHGWLRPRRDEHTFATAERKEWSEILGILQDRFVYESREMIDWLTEIGCFDLNGVLNSDISVHMVANEKMIIRIDEEVTSFLPSNAEHSPCLDARGYRYIYIGNGFLDVIKSWEESEVEPNAIEFSKAVCDFINGTIVLDPVVLEGINEIAPLDEGQDTPLLTPHKEQEEEQVQEEEQTPACPARRKLDFMDTNPDIVTSVVVTMEIEKIETKVTQKKRKRKKNNLEIWMKFQAKDGKRNKK